jgi:hypothetical protein
MMNQSTTPTYMTPPFQFSQEIQDIEEWGLRMSREAEWLCERYGLDANDDGMRFMGEGETEAEVKWDMEQACRRLLNESLWFASDALMQHATGYDRSYTAQHLDDDQDYTNSILAQIDWILTSFHDGDGDLMIERTLRLLNASRAEIDDNGDSMLWNGDSFFFGFADHFTPLSCLMLSNYEDD